MWISNLMLIVLNLPLIGIWVRLLSVSYRLLYPAILVFYCIGVYSLGNRSFDILLTALFGFFGYLCLRLDCAMAPLLGLVLGKMMEKNFRRALKISGSDFASFFTRPLSCFVLAASIVLLLSVLLPAIGKARKVAFPYD